MRWTEGVSAIVPVQDDAPRLETFFEILRQCEILDVTVVDCGSTDDSVAVARNGGAHVYRALPSQADPILRAACNARGHVIWFLSPGCEPPPLAGPYILGGLDLRNVVGGYFPVRCRNASLKHRWRVVRMNWSARWRRNIRVEQGPFVLREVLERCRERLPSGGCTPPALLRCAAGEGRILTMPDPIVLDAFPREEESAEKEA